MLTYFAVLVLVLVAVVWRTAVIVPMRQAVVKERLGRFAGVLEPGLHFLIPIVDRAAYWHETREQVIDVQPQTAITRDNIQVEVDGLLYLKVVSPEMASYGIQDYRRAAVNLAQTTMRSEVGKITLDNSFSERDAINDNIVREIDRASDPWGIKVLRYEIKNINPPAGVIDTMEKQMEAERRKRAEITLATAEKESRVNTSEGERQEAVNISEGEKQKRINEAQGQAKEISLLAEATAASVRRIAQAMQRPAGAMAVRMRVVDQFIDRLGQVLHSTDVSVVPAQLANLKGFFEGLQQVGAAVPGGWDGGPGAHRSGTDHESEPHGDAPPRTRPRRSRRAETDEEG